jgi:hypothetical protein
MVYLNATVSITQAKFDLWAGRCSGLCLWSVAAVEVMIYLAIIAGLVAKKNFKVTDSIE